MTPNLGLRATIYDLLGYVIPGASAMGLGWAYLIPIIGVDAAIAWASKALHAGVVFWIIASLICYVIGHLVNSASSWVLEKWILKDKFLRASDWLGSSDEDIAATVKAEFQDRFGRLPKMKDWMLIRAYMEECAPSAAFTALCFQSFYGMSRSLALVAGCALPWVFCVPGWPCWLRLVGMVVILVVSALFGNQYLRFVATHRNFLAGALVMMRAKRKDERKDKEEQP